MSDGTPDRTATGNHQDTDRNILSLAEAAQALGITPDAVRARLQRGTLEGEKVAGVWRVHLPRRDRDGQPPGSQQDATGTRPDSDRHTDSPLVEQLRSEVAFLREQLAERSREFATERERFDTIHREALGRIEALTAGEDREDAPVEPSDVQDATEPRPRGEPWLRRIWRRIAERLYTR